VPTTPIAESVPLPSEGTPPYRVESARIADQLERAYRGGAWHGPSLAEVIEEVDAALATRRTVARAHTIHEIVWHVGFWTDAVRRRLEGENVDGLAPGSDFPSPPEDPEAAWREAKAKLEDAHRRLHADVLALDDERLDEPSGDSTVRAQLLGLLQHHAWHGGQILVLGRAGAGGDR
jgi:uncharacterized damage-inducible protein DinB